MIVELLRNVIMTKPRYRETLWLLARGYNFRRLRSIQSSTATDNYTTRLAPAHMRLGQAIEETGVPAMVARRTANVSSNAIRSARFPSSIEPCSESTPAARAGTSDAIRTAS